MIQTERLLQTFCTLVSFDSPSCGERKICDYLKETLKQLGLAVTEDDAAEKIGGTAGNIYAVLPATQGMESLPPLLFSGHMDTVEPSHGKQTVVHPDGTITSNGETVLGADDCAALAAILEALSVIQADQLPHRMIEVLFSAAEESYCTGIGMFDFNRIQAKEAYILDISGPVGGAATQAPTILSFRITVHGRASHAGFVPEAGIHAIAIAATAVHTLKNGWLDEQTTRNIGTISGGSQTNIVPELCVVTGEIRSFSHASAMAAWEETQTAFRDAVAQSGAELDMTHTIHVHAYHTPETHPVVKRFEAVCRKQGISCFLRSTMGGSDNNPLSEHGITGIVLATAMNNSHSCTEYTSIEELRRISAITVDLMCAEV
ncbi:M20/M25/M40 family metallo-hydrolase [Butyricicoccus porcorum]|uniref:M20/M25/M40 family metallo-hydrolase n=1 Tax=Butyricicoccus porcorum TaxID=1945634 RepID=UPI002354115C|nr:M20/M25/M40 family metallo-hydrolase [Butyricicoccus porcorum]MDY4483451.1 M20/M25/M40 family metallo-hydrolase [Butyricicoccus porcorum]